ncbi:MAG TPA: protein-glutamate O-methyltransferase CheR, partial [Sphingobacterium sp.]|nr:protein-glutamate O-methyltransferase CheR [Sphingobacterium sp.]
MVELSQNKSITFDELEDILYLLKMSSDFDLSDYSKSSLKRRIDRVMALEQMDLVDLKNAIVNIDGFTNYMMEEISVNVTEMFRDPSFFRALQENVIP